MFFKLLIFEKWSRHEHSELLDSLPLDLPSELFSLLMPDHFSPSTIRANICHSFPGNIEPLLPDNDAKNVITLLNFPRLIVGLEKGNHIPKFRSGS